MAERIAQVQGVQAVASATQIPMGDASFGDVFVRKDLGDRGTVNPSAQVAAVSVGFERALGMTLLRGRTFTRADDSVATMEERMGTALEAQRFRAMLVATIAALTMSLCGLGIYSVVAYSVTQRRREIGIRMALGETAGAVRRRILRGALATCATGAAIGILLALGIVSLGAIAAYVPALRASRIDPVGALRSE